MPLWSIQGKKLNCSEIGNTLTREGMHACGRQKRSKMTFKSASVHGKKCPAVPRKSDFNEKFPSLLFLFMKAFFT